MNCLVTNNPCGVDVWPTLRPCACDNCQTWIRSFWADHLSTILDAVVKDSAAVSPAAVGPAIVAAFQLGYRAGAGRDNK